VASIERAIDEYVALERSVQPVASGSCAPVCAQCRKVCCAARFCEESWTAPWLVAIALRVPGSRRAPGAGARSLEGHLATDGCRLRVGRPPVCYEYACHDVMGSVAGDRQKYLFRVISHILTFAGAEALPGTHLVEVDDLRALIPARVRALRRRIALAGRVFAAARRLFERPERPGDRRDWALVRRHFPARGYRLSGPANAPLPGPGAARAPGAGPAPPPSRAGTKLRPLPILPGVDLRRAAGDGGNDVGGGEVTWVLERRAR
jgi:hypothetical protein